MHETYRKVNVGVSHQILSKFALVMPALILVCVYIHFVEQERFPDSLLSSQMAAPVHTLLPVCLLSDVTLCRGSSIHHSAG